VPQVELDGAGVLAPTPRPGGSAPPGTPPSRLSIPGTPGSAHRGAPSARSDRASVSTAARAALWQAAAPSAQGKVRLAQAGPGSLIGTLDFVLRRPRSHQCLAVTDGHAVVLSRDKYARMARDDPHVHSLVQQMMLRSSLLTTATTQQAMERAVHCACPT
jgi:CRP-like cAMP-binding protein